MNRQITAANNLEDLIPELKQLVIDLREYKDHPYARVYEFRRKISRIVATLGSGYPGTIREP
jgi:hypothetical protein